MNNYIKKILSIGFAGTLAASVVPFNVFASGPKLCGSDIPHNKRRCVLLQSCVVCGERPERIVEVQNIRGEISYVCSNCFSRGDHFNDFIKCGHCDSFISVREDNLNDGYCDDCAIRLNRYHWHNDSEFEERDEDGNINYNYHDPFHTEINNIPERVVYPTRVECRAGSCGGGYKPYNVLLAYYNSGNEDDEGNEYGCCDDVEDISCYTCAHEDGVVIPCADRDCRNSVPMDEYFISKGYCSDHADDQQQRERERQYYNGELDAEYEAFRERADGVVYEKVKNNPEAINEAVRAKGSPYIIDRQAIYNALFPDVFPND